ncbi:glycosyltransferase family 22 protein [Lophiostoma macrostomum CBS 122681]|uniref:Mannosyltransferase n=1 Tax=Lophiostoma macrostomum CBS 122681 TaxID=1314788 RepID=A0A6A6TVN7_9PLEO|nr:glycosyltransferase family 22 protein [Lophiostoma macrostomum CBS 122681]
MFAFFFSTTALKCLLDVYPIQWNGIAVTKRYRLALYLLTFSGVVFRSEIAILVSSITFYLFATRRISITSVIVPAGLAGLLIGLLCSVSIDSFFWQSFPLWPEWIGFYYNTIQGHSAEWGVSPWHFYFSNALPRLLMNPITYLLCIPTALLNAASRRQSLDLIVPSMAFVGLYSLLPHKEWRFIVYVVPALTAVAAAGASWIWTRRAKSVIYSTLSLALVGSVLLSFTASTALLAISSLNYPGGEALDILHNKIGHPEGHHLYVYFDNLACQTGVTRFLERHDGPQTIIDVLEAQNTTSQRTWTYSKTEDPQALLDPTFWFNFDYVLAERPEKVIGSWDAIHTVYGYSGVRLLRPGEKSEKASESPNNSTVPATPSAKATIAQAWEVAESMLRNTVLRGWWVTLRMEPKIRILANGMNEAGEWIET